MRVFLTRSRSKEVARFDITDGTAADPPVDLQESDECTLTFVASPEEHSSGPGAIRLVLSGAAREPVRVETNGGGVTICWSWKIDFYAGEIALEVVDDHRPLWSAVLDVRPHEGKLGREAYDELVADLQDRMDGIAFGVTDAQRGVARSDSSAPLIARFAMLRAYLARLEKSFARIAESPNRRLVAERESRPLDQVRRLDALSVLSIIRSPSALAALGLLTTDVEMKERPRVDHSRREHTFNTPANRYTAALLRQLCSVCRDSRAAFALIHNGAVGDLALQARAAGLAEEASIVQRRIERLGRAEFLGGVPPVSGDTAALIAVAKDPLYSRFDWLARQALTPRLDLWDGAICEKLWLRKTYELYEYWCLFRVAEALSGHWPGVAWQFSLEASQDGLLMGIRDGCHMDARIGDVCLRLTFQQTFQAYKPEFDGADEPYSVSGERRPDIVLAVEEGPRAILVLLDAKYRCSRESIHAALGDMHVYRDSLRVSGAGGRPLAAFILTPNHDENCGSYYTSRYRRTHATGGFDLSPGRPDQARDLAEQLAIHIRMAGIRFLEPVEAAAGQLHEPRRPPRSR